MSIYVAGSLAFDRIMSFNGAFADHILADKLHILNVSFLIDGQFTTVRAKPPAEREATT